MFTEYKKVQPNTGGAPKIPPVSDVEAFLSAPQQMYQMRVALDMSQNKLDDFLGLARGSVYRYEKENWSSCGLDRFLDFYRKLFDHYWQQLGDDGLTKLNG